MRHAVFFDRDGVLNLAIVRDGKPYPPRSTEELELTAGAAELLERLKQLGLVLVVVTNQPDVARGRQTRAMIEAIHARMAATLLIDQFRVCYHDDADQCGCRKPKPGLLADAAAELGLDLQTSYMVGDRWRDVDAGAAAGCKTVWIDHGYSERGPTQAPTQRASSLREAVEWILGQEKNQCPQDE
jgi:D-glycero-D-manno-heptose 1,7-bisphosphate phosphatase